MTKKMHAEICFSSSSEQQEQQISSNIHKSHQRIRNSLGLFTTDKLSFNHTLYNQITNNVDDDYYFPKLKQLANNSKTQSMDFCNKIMTEIEEQKGTNLPSNSNTKMNGIKKNMISYSSQDQEKCQQYSEHKEQAKQQLYFQSSVKKLNISYSSQDECQSKVQDKQNNIEEENKQLNPQSQVIKTFKFLKSCDFIDKKLFSMKNIPNDYVLRLEVKRNKSGFNRLWPQYDFHIDNFYNFMSVKKDNGLLKSHYYISTDKQDFLTEQNLIAKIQQPFMSSDYNIYRYNHINNNIATLNRKTLIATFTFYSGQSQNYSPRCFLLYVIKQPFSYFDLEGTSQKKEVSLSELYNISSNQDKIIVYRNRKAMYISSTKTYVLDFSGRINEASIKNFIIQEFNGRQVAMFGRLTNDQFILDISSPLSPIVALGAVIANFDFKTNN